MTAQLTPIHEVTLAGSPRFTSTIESFMRSGVVRTSIDFRSQFVGLEVPEVAELAHMVSRSSDCSADEPDDPIIRVVGKFESSLSHFIDFLSVNKKVEEGFSFELRGRDGNLWVVYGGWLDFDGGWYIDAYLLSLEGE